MAGKTPRENRKMSRPIKARSSRKPWLAGVVSRPNPKTDSVDDALKFYRDLAREWKYRRTELANQYRQVSKALLATERAAGKALHYARQLRSLAEPLPKRRLEKTPDLQVDTELGKVLDAIRDLRPGTEWEAKRWSHKGRPRDVVMEGVVTFLDAKSVGDKMIVAEIQRLGLSRGRSKTNIANRVSQILTARLRQSPAIFAGIERSRPWTLEELREWL